MNTRLEKDSLGELQVPAEAYYGVHTCREMTHVNRHDLAEYQAIPLLGRYQLTQCVVNTHLEELEA